VNQTPRFDRRDFLLTLPAVAAVASLGKARAMTAQAVGRGKPTNFQIACMTLPYSQFPLQRALEGIARSGFKYVALGTRHMEAPGRQVPVLEMDAKPTEAKKVGDRCRDLGMTPVLMFSTVYVEAPDGLDAHKKKIEQAAAAGIPQLLTFGHTEGGKLDVWVKNLKILGPLAREVGVTVVIKQHGGETGTGEACAKIVREVADAGVWMNYDAGNVMDYLDVDPLPDIRKCTAEIRSFCIKDHRNFPKDEDCGPGLGEIDHYRLLEPVAFTGLNMPLACENISAPVLPRPNKPEGVDALAKRAREFLEIVTQGVQTPVKKEE
jgi:sugar phosphate isomerase/epimerase